jgi:Zn-finger nucleic acid-binding protein
MAEHALGGCVLDQCGACGGVWLDADEFSRIREDRDAQAAFVGPGAPSAVPTADPTTQPLVYLPCPRCGELMNRVNFAGTSGIVLDTCRTHGTWFDKDELPAVIEFIRAGGLDDARRQALERLRLERARLERADRPVAADLLTARPFDAEDEGPAGLALAGRLLRALLP